MAKKVCRTHRRENCSTCRSNSSGSSSSDWITVDTYSDGGGSSDCGGGGGGE